ncbi:hypothetical protein SAPIS_v1c07450 [Spiroplasma apis B31]|uniref:Uncharacterized protein n=1 Tax=Spiroplasma apis B31 TaxID=1276258 RepID=V5RLA0_SPIAP|nr:hypothetical protein SAPIS_v1c07450 [Spiroplasma apis B31]
MSCLLNTRKVNKMIAFFAIPTLSFKNMFFKCNTYVKNGAYIWNEKNLTNRIGYL